MFIYGTTKIGIAQIERACHKFFPPASSRNETRETIEETAQLDPNQKSPYIMSNFVIAQRIIKCVIPVQRILQTGMTVLLKRDMTAITLCSYRIYLYIEAPPSLFFAADMLCSLI